VDDELDTADSDLDTVGSNLSGLCSQLWLEEALTGVYSC